MAALICPTCKGNMVLKSNAKGVFYGCENYPGCTTTLGAHQHSKAPLGIPGDEYTRQRRIEAHIWFDLLWKPRAYTRKAAYKWLCKTLDIPPKYAHIGYFSAQQCEELIDAVLTHLFEELGTFRPSTTVIKDAVKLPLCAINAKSLSEAINSLPMPLREYIHNIETVCDPAGMVQEIAALKQNEKHLLARIEYLNALLEELQNKSEEAAL